ncbi:MAG: hypothetical protein HY904_03075 [Deltaproteobacteria bacterium]|nr:hypothetical protein [Deltaproteobacteria bacterium]
MAKVLLLSILIASFVIPYSAAGEPDARGALRRALLRMALFAVAYGLCLRFVYWRLL